MDRDKLKLIIRNLELLIYSLKKELELDESPRILNDKSKTTDQINGEIDQTGSSIF